jgi:hypothetical protein
MLNNSELCERWLFICGNGLFVAHVARTFQIEKIQEFIKNNQIEVNEIANVFLSSEKVHYKNKLIAAK